MHPGLRIRINFMRIRIQHEKNFDPDPAAQMNAKPEPELLLHLRGVLGNKCAGQHNLKTIHIKDTIVSGNIWPRSSAICVFFAALLICRMFEKLEKITVRRKILIRKCAPYI